MVDESTGTTDLTAETSTLLENQSKILPIRNRTNAGRMTNIAVTVISGPSIKDLSVSYSDQETAAALVAAIQDGVGAASGARVYVQRTGRTIDADSVMADVDLLHGDVLELIGTDGPAALRPYLERMGDIGPVRVEIPVSGVRVGRMAVGNDLVLDDPTVSKVHASITSVGQMIVVDDLGSTNGTTVNGTPIAGETKLNVGDIVEFGDHARFMLTGASSIDGPDCRRLPPSDPISHEPTVGCT